MFQRWISTKCVLFIICLHKLLVLAQTWNGPIENVITNFKYFTL